MLVFREICACIKSMIPILKVRLREVFLNSTQPFSASCPLKRSHILTLTAADNLQPNLK